MYERASLGTRFTLTDQRRQTSRQTRGIRHQSLRHHFEREGRKP